MSVQRLFPVPDKSPLFVIRMELTCRERAKVQKIVMNNL